MVVKTKKNIKKNTKLKTKFMKGGVVTDEELHEGFINLFKEFDLEYDSINQPFIDLEQPEQSQEYVANLMNMLWDVGKADFFNKEDVIFNDNDIGISGKNDILNNDNKLTKYLDNKKDKTVLMIEENGIYKPIFANTGNGKQSLFKTSDKIFKMF